MQPSANSAPRYVRRWRVPPPLTRGSELLEGSAILGEIPGEAGVLLWKAVRNVSLWAEAGPAEMDGLFAPSAHARRLAEIAVAPLEDRVREPLELLAQLLEDPAHASPEVMALACRRVALWAEDRGAVGTALCYQQAAALACPGEARHAYEVGRLARQGGEMARAESWYRRAIMLGRQSSDWYSYARAYLGLGTLLRQRGSLPTARRVLVKGLRAARRHSLRPVVAMAYHDLLTVCMDASDYDAAPRYARAALRAYPPKHPRLPALANDTACLWVETGNFGQALLVFQQTLRHLGQGRERLVVLGNIARAAGGAGDARAFEAARDQLLEGIGHEPHAGSAQGLLNLARGAASLARWDEASTAARQAREAAETSNAAQIVFEAESVLQWVANQPRAGQRPASPLPAPEPAEAADELARDLVASLQSG